MRLTRLRSAVITGLALAGLVFALPTHAQDRGTMDPHPHPPLAHPDDTANPAKEVFGREAEPSAGPPHVYGFYSRGCIAGAQALAMDGPTWEVMRPSRNRFYGHPALLAFIERFSERFHKSSGQPGILIGDMAQPRGGPMLGGHASHQIGLDVDVWLRTMPEKRLTRQEREFMDSVMVVRGDRKDVDPRLFTPDTMAMIKAAAVDPAVQRIFVNAAIKKAICREAKGDRSWLAKVRPYYHHDYHLHIRLYCPPGESGCEPQKDIERGDGCDASLNHWFSESILHPRPSPKPSRPAAALTMAGMSPACRAVAAAPGQQIGAR